MVGKLAERLKEIVIEVAQHFGIEIIEQETDKDHIHILFSSQPTVMLSRFVNSLKSATSRKLRSSRSYEKGTLGWEVLVSILLHSNNWTGKTGGRVKR